MGNYYFLSPFLPPLTLGNKSDFSFDELVWALSLNLTQKDLVKTVVLRRLIDLNNIRSLILEETINPKGNLSEKELRDALLLKEGLPAYVFDFLNRFETFPEMLRFFSGLIGIYFREEIAVQSGFLKRYLDFERTSRIVLMALRSRQLKRDLFQELQFEDLSDPLIVDLLAQKEVPTYTPPADYIGLKEQYLSCGSDPWEQNKAVAKWRFDQIERLTERPLFSIDWVLCYMAQLLIIEQWNEMDLSKGKIILEAFVN